MLRKVKVHLILHLPEDMLAYGPTSSFNTERYMYPGYTLIVIVLLILHAHIFFSIFETRCESFNSLVRSETVYSNKQSPSKDIAYGVARLEHVQYIASGGKFGSGDETLVLPGFFLF